MSSPAFFPKFRAFDHSTGAPLAGGLLFTYAAGTTNPQATYTNASLATPNANPVVLDANGEADVFVGGATYKFILQNSVGVTQWTEDNIAWGVPSTPSVSGTNLILNGGFDFVQAGTSLVPAAATGVLPIDGWAYRIVLGTAALANFTFSRQSSANSGGGPGLPGSPWCLRIARAAGAGTATISVVQNLSFAEAQQLGGVSSTLSYYYRKTGALINTITATSYYGTVIEESWQTAGTLTNQSNAGTITPPAASSAFAQAYGSSVQSPDLSLSQGVSIVFTIDFQGIAAGGGDYAEIGCAQLELGAIPTAFEHYTQDEGLRRVQRRYYKTFPQNTVPAQNAGLPGAIVIPQTVGAAAAMAAPLWIPPWMRDTVAGTVTTYNPSAANANARNTTVGADCGAPTILAEAGPFVAISTMNSAGGSAAGNNNRLHYTVDRRF